MNAVIKQKIMRFATIAAGLLILVLGLGVPSGSARADIGPKPTMSFEFIFETGTPLIITDGILLQCQDTACQDANPLEELGPQHFSCTETECNSMAYGYTEYNRLVITYSDGMTRESNIFGKNYFEAKYQVTVRADSLDVIEQRGGTNPMNFLLIAGAAASIAAFCAAVIVTVSLLVILGLFIRNASKGAAGFQDSRWLYIAAWLIAVPIVIFGSWFSLAILATIVIEIVIGVLYALIRKLPRLRLFTIILLANLITQPLLWLALAAGEGLTITLILTIVLELLIWIVEAIILFLTMRDKLRFLEALGLSFLLNIISFGVGLLLAI